MTRADEGPVKTEERLADVLSGVARLLQVETDVDSTVTAIVTAAVHHIDGTEHAGVSLIDHGQLRTVAPTSGLVVDIDRLQYEAKEGPCIDAIVECQTFRTGDLRGEARWPEFGPAAAAKGIRSMLSYRLFVTASTLGALNLYSSTPDAFSEDAEDEGRLFASHAAVALNGAQTEANLHAAIAHRDLIGMAKGILMERHDCDASDGFRLLVEASQASNLKLRDVAVWLVEHRGER